MSVELILPCLQYEKSYAAYIAELGNEERYPFPLDFEHGDFPALLQRLDEFAHGINIPKDMVASTTYWLVKNSELIGVSNLRHYLNDRIKHCGGHIGLGIRPSCRGQGQSTLLMKLTIAQARKRGVGELHVHCHKDNQASARMIMNNGGLLHSEIERGDPAEIIQRYVIPAVT